MRESVVFDRDGLLPDTEKLWQEGERRLFTEYGQEYTAEHQQRLIGTSGVETGGILAEVLVQQGRGLALLSELRELVWEAIVNGAQPMPGALDLVRELSAKIPLGVASNSPRELVREALGSAGLDGAFDLILGEEDVKYPKPNAQIYLAASEPELRSTMFGSLRRLAAWRGRCQECRNVRDRGSFYGGCRTRRQRDRRFPRA
jgi:beta-phosphoglucomutase-like phosphatase (HAD superfamily)